MRRLRLLVAALVLLLAAPAAARAADVATLAVSGGALTVTGLPGKANVTVVVNPSVTGTPSLPGTYFVGDQNGTVKRTSGACTQTTQGGIHGWLCLGVNAITENLADGGDTGIVSDRAGSGVPSRISGGPGDDTLVGGPEADAFSGGTGTDSVAYVAPTGTGITRTAPVTAVLPEPGAAPTTGNGAAGENDSIAGDVEGLVGGNGSDTLTGNSAANTIAGAAPPGTAGVATSPAGHDTIDGAGGDDTLLAGDSGAVSGGPGDDTIVGGRSTSATTTVSGGPGDDQLVSGLGDDDLSGGAGADTVAYASVPMAGLDRGTSTGVQAALPETGTTATGGARGGAEHDVIHDDVETLVGSNGPDVLAGSSRADTIAGAAPPGTPNVVTSPAGDDTISGGAGDDQLVAGDDGTVHGDAGDDTIVGGRHATTLYGDDGSDRLVSGLGDDAIHGGAGADYLVYAAVGQVGITRAAGVTARLADAAPTTRNGNRAAGEDDTVYGDVENLVGGNGNDRLTGNAGPNTILGVAPAGTPGVTPGPPGNDVLDGAGGDDILLGDAGNDFLIGGPGHDTLSAGAGDDILVTRDGIAEAPACGAGNDLVSADTLDTPAPDCERVDTTGPIPRPDTSKPKLREHPHTVRLRHHRRARLWLRCRNEPHGCHGRMVLRTRHHGHRLLAKRTFRIGHATSKRFTLHLRRRVLKLLPHHHRLRTTLRVTAQDHAGNRTHRTFHVTLKRR